MFHPIVPYRFRASDDALADIERRLMDCHWPDEVEAEPWRYGPPTSFMREVVDYWLNRYDWRHQEAKINALPHFRTEIKGEQIHFIHQRGRGPNPIPLILTHGWPGSFVEMLRILPLLTDPAANGGSAEDSFSIIIPSIPGYGFSSRPKVRGMGISAIADIWAKLAERLGYPSFGVQGGDWGSWISATAALRHPDRVLGLHLNYLSTRFRPPLTETDPPLSEEEEGYLSRIAAWTKAEGAYIAIQGTKPLTLAYAMTDSPLGLAAWYFEKYRSWSGCLDRPDEAIPMDEMITNIMIHWLTGTVHSALRLYSESLEQPFHLSPGERILPPCGITHLPDEIPMPPRSWADRAFNIVHWTQLPRGGHFAAWEVPDLLAHDIRAFFRPLRSEMSVQGTA